MWLHIHDSWLPLGRDGVLTFFFLTCKQLPERKVGYFRRAGLGGTDTVAAAGLSSCGCDPPPPPRLSFHFLVCCFLFILKAFSLCVALHPLLLFSPHLLWSRCFICVLLPLPGVCKSVSVRSSCFKECFGFSVSHVPSVSWTLFFLL